MRQQLSGPMLTRAAASDVAILDETTRRFRLSFSSEAPYERSSYFEDPWIEVLGHKAGEVDMSRLLGGAAPLLYGHNRFAKADHVGVVEKAWIERARGYAEVRLSMRAELDDLWRDIKDGIVRNVSVGYQILERVLTKKNSQGPSEFRVTRWAPFEVSVVTVPADATVGIGRADTPEPQRFTIKTLESDMDLETAPNNAQSEPNERARSAAILDLTQRHGFDPTQAAEWVGSNLTIEQIREAAMEKLAQRDVHHAPHIEGEAPWSMAESHDRGNDFQRAAIDGLLLSSGISVAKPHPAARDTRNLPLRELARSCLSRAGIRHSGLRESKLYERAMSTSDFPLILSGAIGAAMGVGYEQEPASHRIWVRTQLVQDFKEQHRPAIGSMPELLPVGELEEYKDGPISEADSTKYRVGKFGRIVSLSWELIKNDNLGAFLRVLPGLGQAARRSEADGVYNLFTLNSGAGPTMSDSKALFHIDHKNLATAGSMDIATLGAARALMRKQQALGGGYLSLVPRFLIVPVDLETQAEYVLAQVTRHTVTKTTGSGPTKTVGVEGTPTPEWVSQLTLVVEPRLADDVFYLAADSSQVDTIELGLLDESGGAPMIATDEGFRVDSMRWKVRHVHGAAAIDYRGMVKVPIASGQ